MNAGKMLARGTERVVAGGKFFAVADGTSAAHLRLVAVTPSATRAELALEHIGAALAAIDATGRNDQRIPWLNSHDLVCHPVPPFAAAVTSTRNQL
jgi:hypothetical protein